MFFLFISFCNFFFFVSNSEFISCFDTHLGDFIFCAILVQTQIKL
jgi:hypothetical protein